MEWRLVGFVPVLIVSIFGLWLKRCDVSTYILLGSVDGDMYGVDDRYIMLDERGNELNRMNTCVR